MNHHKMMQMAMVDLLVFVVLLLLILFVRKLDFSSVDKNNKIISFVLASQQYTLAVIRPDAYADGKVEEIVDKVN